MFHPLRSPVARFPFRHPLQDSQCQGVQFYAALAAVPHPGGQSLGGMERIYQLPECHQWILDLQGVSWIVRDKVFIVTEMKCKFSSIGLKDVTRPLFRCI